MKDEWAFIAAHELSHIELGHYQEKQRQIGTIYTVAGIAMLFSQGKYNPLNDPYFVLVAKIALASYSRDQETAADLRGVQIMRSAGFDPHAAISTLLKLGPKGQENTGDLFADHPSTIERINRIRSEIGE
jgi:predicted Zn-dependent protease